MKKKVQKLIEENFRQDDAFKDDELENDSLFKISVGDILDDKVEEFPTDLGNRGFRSKIFPGDVLVNDVSRKRTQKSLNSGKDFFDSPSENEDLGSDGDADVGMQKKKKRFNQTVTSESETDVEDANASEAENESDREEPHKTSSEAEDDESDEEQDDEEQDELDEEQEDESDIDDDLSEVNEEEDHPSFVYSGGIRDTASELEKGMAVRSQLNLWEVLLESRITLQKCLVDSNKLPKPGKFSEVWSQCTQENKNSIVDCRETLWDLLEKLLHVQNKFRKQCSEFMDTLDAESKEDIETELKTDNFKVKRRKLTEYSSILEKQHTLYAPFRDRTIQKWNDRTKIASGKFAKSNFSAFDQPVLKQIEQIMSDKHRLIQKTHVKRSEYNIIGENSSQENENSSSNDEKDREIFDDDDFYHKLLRDYIERKTADISDPTQLTKKWIKLQSLRNKMKRRVDTRRTKGRKIKFDVHTKLVNFMAPNTLQKWEDNAINELYSSVFGKSLLNT